MSNKILEITNEIHQAWIDVEKQMANFDGDDHAAVISHDYIGKALYDKHLEVVKTIIYDNSNEDITAEFIDSKLKQSNE